MYTYRIFERQKDPEFDPTFILRFSVGDHLHGCVRYAEARSIKFQIQPVDVQTTEPLDQIPDDGIKMYRYRVKNQSVRTAWTTSEIAAKVLAEAKCIENLELVLETGILTPRIVKDPQLPFEAVLERGDKGLYMRAELHPEANGEVSGKYYFPDRSCTGLCTGPAIINSIADRVSYGFMTCTMKQYKMPDQWALFEYLLEMQEHGEYTTAIIVTPFGRLVRVKNDKMTYILGNTDETPEDECNQADELIDPVAELSSEQLTVECEYPIPEFICRHALQCSEKEFAQRFIGCSFHSPDAEDEEDPDNLMLEVSETMVIERKRVGTISYYTIDWKNLYQVVAQFNTDELDTIIRLVNKVNDKANYDITEQLRTGKMRLSL